MRALKFIPFLVLFLVSACGDYPAATIALSEKLKGTTWEGESAELNSIYLVTFSAEGGFVLSLYDKGTNQSGTLLGRWSVDGGILTMDYADFDTQTYEIREDGENLVIKWNSEVTMSKK